MKIKLIDILNSREVLLKLANIKFEDEETTLKLLHNIKKINPELFNFDENKKRLTDEYNKQMIEMLEKEIDINIQPIDPVKIFGFSAIELLSLDWLFKPEKEE